MLKIGSLELKSNFILAPMAGVSDYPFRMLNRKYGCELAFVEMINARALGYNSQRTKGMLYTTNKDKPLGVQLLGSDPLYLLRALDILQDYRFELLDFNAACPAKKVVSRGEGASLLKDPKKLKRLLKTLVKNCDIPVTVKIRTGWNKDWLCARDVSLAAQDAGVSAIFIHGRSKAQEYTGEVDYATIKTVKNSVDVPVIASGDIFSPELAKKMFDETGCDGVIVARGCLGNPWIFPQLEEFFKNSKTLKKPTLYKLVKAMSGHLKEAVDFHGEKLGVIIFRKFFIWYTKGFVNMRPLRQKVFSAKTKANTLKVIKEFYMLAKI